MFAPKVAKAQTKAAENPTSKMTPQRSTLTGHRLGHDPVERALFLQRTIGNQAMLRLLAQQTSRRAVSNPPSDYEQGGVATENTMARETPRGSASWDFSRIPLFPPDRASRGSSPQPGIIQRKLVVGQANDPLEHEADRVADQVMRTLEIEPAAAPPQIGRKCPDCEQRKGAGTAKITVSEAPGSVHEALHSPGQPLDPATRAYFEPRFGRDFSGVRVHADAAAAQSARDVNAHAYTVGHNMVFGAGQFAPGTHEGQRLIAHELTHTVQQSGSAAAVQRAPTPAGDPSAERAAAVAEAEHDLRVMEQDVADEKAQDALGLKWRKRNDNNYAWSLGLKDRARIQKSGKLSPEFQQEIAVKFRFFKGEARAAYIQTIGPALVKFPEETVDILAEFPSTEKSCAIGQSLLVYQGKPGQGRCLPENDPEFRQNYIDNNIVQAYGSALPDTTWGNIDHDRIPQVKLTYKDGSTLVVDVKDIPRVDRRHPQTVGAIRPLTYEKRSDGFIYPIRSGTVSYVDAYNIVSLREGLYDGIEELKLKLQLMELVVEFGGPRGPLRGYGGIVALVGHPGELFEPVPKKTRAPATEEPASTKGAPDKEPGLSSRGPGAAHIHDESFAANRKYVGSPKHTGTTRRVGGVEVSREPTDGQAALEDSFPLPNTNRRIGVDVKNKEFVVLDRTGNLVKDKKVVGGEYHGHVRSWDGLSSNMRAALKPIVDVDKSGRWIINPNWDILE
jgi:hypothetical protein